MSNENETGLAARPSFLPAKQAGGGIGTEALSRVVVPPRLKVVQATSSPELLSEFSAGDLIISPQNVKICDKDNGEFNFVPIYFWTEFISWNPLQMKGQLDAIRDRSMDINSEVAKKCLSPKHWFETCPENKEYKIRNCEHLNFVVMPIGVDGVAETPIVVSFSRAEHKVGRNFAGLIKMREADIFACVFTANVEFKHNTKGQWHGLNIHNPSSMSQWVENEEKYNFYKELHEKYAEAEISVAYEEDEGEPTESTGEF
jgi:hypothetical protein